MKTSKTDNNNRGTGQKTNDTPRPGMTETLRPNPGLGAVQKSASSGQSTPAGSSKVVPLKAARPGLTAEQIAERAKAIWIQHGRAPGQDQANWLEAEAQLKKELGIQ